MKKILFMLLFSTIIVYGNEIIFRRQAIPRVNLIKIDDIILSIDKEKNQWVIRAKKGSEQRLAPIVSNKINYLFFPGLILSVKNWNLANSSESWNIMQETIGEFEITKYSPQNTKLVTGEPITMVENNNQLTLSNGFLSIKLSPQYNGIIWSMRDNLSGYELFNGIANASAITQKTFQGVGFIELIDVLGKTPEANLSSDWNNQRLTLTGLANSVKNTIWKREIYMEPDSFSISIKTLALPKENCDTKLTIKHRPEFALPYGKLAAITMLLPHADGRLKAISPQENSAYEPKGQSYALAYHNQGVILLVNYENAEQLYIWCDKTYLALEAFGRESMVENRPHMKVSYNLIHGMNNADFISKTGVIKLSPSQIKGIEGEKMEFVLTYGSSMSLKSPNLKISIFNHENQVVHNFKTSLKKIIAGYSDSTKISFETKGIAAGEYQLSLDLADDKKTIISGKIPLRILSKNSLKEYQNLLKNVNNQIDKIRKETSGIDRRNKMKRFKTLTLMRKAIEDALSTADLKQLERLNIEFLSQTLKK